ncbi:MAG: helix-turn-helix domain-containing protein [Prevotella sp.]|nr:helix-turn-helix domain-containing protein [Prevotella sp.]
MVNNRITDATLEEAKQWGNAEYMTDGLILTDRISEAPIPQSSTRLNFILMAMCKKGKAQYSIDTRQQVVKPGDLLFVSERHVIDNYEASPDFECLCIMLTTEYYHGFVQDVKNVSSLLLFSMNNPVVPLTSKEIQVFTNYFETIREKMADTSHHYRSPLVKALLLAMFYDMSNVIYRVERQGNWKHTRAEAIFAHFIRLLEENFRTQHRVSWYAEQLCITPKYLSEIVKKISLRTPNEWIDSYVILEARVLLKNTTKSIKEITDELNFPNQSFLGKYFKEHVGVSPSEYRKR